MTNKNEMIFINKILNTELTIRKTAKQFGLRRDDLIRRMEEALAGDEENLKQLRLVIVINKMLFDNLPMKEAAEELKLTEKELDRRILSTLANNPDKLKRYQEYKKPNQNKIQKAAKDFHKKDAKNKAKTKKTLNPSNKVNENKISIDKNTKENVKNKTKENKTKK